MRPKPLAAVLAATLTISCAAVQSFVNPAPDSTPTPSQLRMPKIETDRDAFERAFDEQGAEMLWDLPNEKIDEDLNAPGVVRFTVNLAPGDIVDVATGWCAQTPSILSDNLDHFTPILIINGRSLAPDGAQTFDWDVDPGEDPDHPEGQKCRSWEVLASDWPTGTHTVTEGWKLDATINDGDSAFVAGDYLYEYTITVAE